MVKCDPKIFTILLLIASYGQTISRQFNTNTDGSKLLLMNTTTQHLSHTQTQHVDNIFFVMVNNFLKKKKKECYENINVKNIFFLEFEVPVVCQLSKYRIYSCVFLVSPSSQHHPKICQLVMV